MGKLNTLKTIDSVKEKIDRNYDLTCDNINDILLASNINVDLIVNGFYLGYAQGLKAQNKALRKAKKRG